MQVYLLFTSEVVLYVVAQQSWGQGKTFQFSSGYSISFVGSLIS